MDDSTLSSSSALPFHSPIEASSSSSTSSSNFNFLCIGNEAEKLKWLVLNHVRPNALKKMFEPLMQKRRRAVNLEDELVCVQACMLLQSLTDRNKQPVELEQACLSLIGLLSTEKTHLNALDRIITKIIMAAYEEKVITLLLTCQLLVASIDFRMKIPLNPQKIRFVRKSMDQLDYKNMRDLLKQLLVEKLDKMQCQLTEYQQRNLAPIEELVIDLIDRSKNYCPALFFINEISRMDPCHTSIHFLPRVSWKIREMIASFRPLAEIGSMLGRSWMWPVPASPSFSWSSPTCSAWKLDEKQCKLYFKTHLPYSSENTTPQTYLQYILFKQPHGQDNLNHILRSSTSQTPCSRIQCDEVIQLLILEAMCAMEDSEQPVLAPVNQYNWLHLSHLVTHALYMQNCTLSELLKMLLPQLRSCQYLRAKDELMWILLQLVAYARSREKNLVQQQQQQNGQSGAQILSVVGLGAQNRELVLDIFNVLYTDKNMNWATTCSTENPLNMVFLCLLAIALTDFLSILFAFPIASTSEESQPQPPEKLKPLIDFIEKQLDASKPLDKTLALLAVIANSYSNNREVFEEHVSSAVFRILGQSIVHQQQPHQPEKCWVLPGGRRTEQNLRALDLTFLDSLTFHAKVQIYKSTFRLYSQLFHKDATPNFALIRLPTPALVESLARLLLSTELIDLNGAIFYMHIFSALHYATNVPTNESEQKLYPVRIDFLAVLLELHNFRLQNIVFGWKWSIEMRSRFLYQVLEALVRSPVSAAPCPSSNTLQLCALLEQTIQRFVQCTWPQDLLNFSQLLMGKTLPNPLMAMPEYYRLFLLAVFRAVKLLGADHLQFSSQDLGQRWPLSELRWFPPNILRSIVPNESDLPQLEQMQLAQQAQEMVELQNISFQEAQRLMHLDAEFFGLDSPPCHPTAPSLLVSIFRCLHEFTNFHPQLPPGKQSHQSAPNFPALCYKLLSLQSNRDLHRSTNALVDYLVWKCQGDASQAPSGMLTDESLSLQQIDLRMVGVLNDMLFVHQFVSVERFLLSLALHPSDDSSIRTSLFLLAALLDNKLSSFYDRLHACHSFAPAHSNTTSANSEEFFIQIADFSKKYPEYSYTEMYRKTMDSTFQQSPEQQRDLMNLPIYYGHLADRILPLIDVIFQRALEVDIGPKVLDSFLRNFGPLYRLHPQPMTFLYETLYTLDSFNRDSPIGRQTIRKFVVNIVLKLEQEEGTHGTRAGTGYHSKLLTPEFVLHHHNMPPIRFCRVLVERIVQASTYTHQPPQFVHRDWRFAEYPPAGQALTSAWVELLASQHTPAVIVDALVDLAIRRPIFRPQDTLNALGLLLTGLPSSFQAFFLDRIEESFDWSQIASADADPSQLFESLSHEVYLHSDSRILSMLALIHSFCQHGGNNSLSIIPDFVINRLAHKVDNEAQLVYFLRIVVPYLQRIHEKERNKHMPEVSHGHNVRLGQLQISATPYIISIYNVLGDLVQKVGQLHYEDTICDLLYQFKYMFVGYTLKEQTEIFILNFPDSMREKLKFLFTHSSTAAAAVESQQQMLQQQQLHHQQFQGNLMNGGGLHLPPGAHPPHFSSGAFPPLSSAGQQLSFPMESATHQQQQQVLPLHHSQQQQQPAALIGMLQRQSREDEGQRQNQAGQMQQQINPNQQQVEQMGTAGSITTANQQQQQSTPAPLSVSSVSSAALSPHLMVPFSCPSTSSPQQGVPPPPPYQIHPMAMSDASVGHIPSHAAFPASSAGPSASTSSFPQHPSMVMHSHAVPPPHHQQQMVSSVQFQQQQHQHMLQQHQMASGGVPISFGSVPNTSAEALPSGTFFPMGFQPHQMHSHQMTAEHHQPPPESMMAQHSFPSHFSQSGSSSSSAIPPTADGFHRQGM
ncbi:hypothetical protein niasHS_013255 [Heterodera schachtii]|uniref:Mediator of RNA polymerase II transcription subunit 23 n=1 Tax=Heterodera schachtii TaxID=97005 RepID=A0ABD2IDR0_HETSC